LLNIESSQTSYQCKRKQFCWKNPSVRLEFGNCRDLQPWAALVQLLKHNKDASAFNVQRTNMLASLKPKKGLRKRLGESLLADGMIGDDQLRRALERQHHGGGFLGEILVSLGFVSPNQLKPYLESVSGFTFVDLSEVDLDAKICSVLPEGYAASKLVLPFAEEDGRVLVAMADPVNVAVVDDLRTKLQKPIQPLLALHTDIEEAIRRAYDVRTRTKDLLDGMRENAQVEVDETADLADEAQRAPVVRLVNEILSSAMAAGASDIHIEPQEDNVRVRFRIDGVLHEQMTIPTAYLPAAISRLKVMSSLDIAERRRPQDGRFAARDDRNSAYDVRLSIMPTVYGEKACMRLLEKSNDLAQMDRLGFLPEQRAQFEKFIRKPHGLILVTGPTGSGKSTTLYAALQRINNPGINISTVEDPVEYKLAGINQTQVNPKIGVDFATGLRTLVRQDPDVILVGEIRDRQTAEIAIQAALTGHLVLSSLHTNDAAGAVVRLQNMGIEPFLISSAVIGVVGQRLMRMVCPNCRETSLPSTDMCQSLGIDLDAGRAPLLARGIGCKRCGGRGMKGRTAAMEVLPMTDTLRTMVLKEASAMDLANQAASEGLLTMRQAAMRKALDLTVPAEEIIRVFAEDN
jgi:type IV pilus assembly protein PilB